MATATLELGGDAESVALDSQQQYMCLALATMDGGDMVVALASAPCYCRCVGVIS
jgi:hypothetical protein